MPELYLAEPLHRNALRHFQQTAPVLALRRVGVEEILLDDPAVVLRRAAVDGGDAVAGAKARFPVRLRHIQRAAAAPHEKAGRIGLVAFAGQQRKTQVPVARAGQHLVYITKKQQLVQKTVVPGLADRLRVVARVEQPVAFIHAGVIAAQDAVDLGKQLLVIMFHTLDYIGLRVRVQWLLCFLW